MKFPIPTTVTRKEMNSLFCFLVVIAKCFVRKGSNFLMLRYNLCQEASENRMIKNSTKLREWSHYDGPFGVTF
jgi:ferredoxin-like protein FixX